MVMIVIKMIPAIAMIIRLLLFTASLLLLLLPAPFISAGTTVASGIVICADIVIAGTVVSIVVFQFYIQHPTPPLSILDLSD